MSLTQIDPKLLRAALGAFATGVTIVTTRAPDGRPVGLTASSFNSVSLDPPLVLWSLALNSQYLEAFRHTRCWAVHILAADQEALSTRFASRVPDRYADLAWHEGEGGVPLLDGCSARFVCRTAFEYEGGDHAILVGQVTDLARAGAPPLIFHGGRYRAVMPETLQPPTIEPGDEGEFGRHFIGHLLSRVHNEAFADVRREYRRRGLRARDYTVLSAMGFGGGQSRAAFMARVARGGFEVADETIDGMIGRRLICEEGDVLRLTADGRQQLMELIAVAQASQLRIESRLAPKEMAMLLHLLHRAIAIDEKQAVLF